MISPAGADALRARESGPSAAASLSVARRCLATASLRASDRAGVPSATGVDTQSASSVSTNTWELRSSDSSLAVSRNTSLLAP